MDRIEAGQIASTTLRQINEGDFWASSAARWGVKGTSAAEDGTLVLRCLRNLYISITLDGEDLYVIKITKLKTGKHFGLEELAQTAGISNAALVRTIDSMYDRVAK